MFVETCSYWLTTMTDKQGVPDNVASRVEDFHRSLSDLQTTLQPVLNQLKDIHKKASQDFESQANLDLTLCLVVNSLYWSKGISSVDRLSLETKMIDRSIN